MRRDRQLRNETGAARHKARPLTAGELLAKQERTRPRAIARAHASVRAAGAIGPLADGAATWREMREYASAWAWLAARRG